ncbi:stage II sporulation protein M [Egibacter rhizosphaerae]|nr:stage II sporulation protein M [Egibacter rhizosphaerae]
MTIDGFIRMHEHEWEELRDLLRRASRDGRSLSPDELERLTALYQRVGTHLSLARARYADPGLVTELSSLVGQASSLLHGRRVASWRQAARFFTQTVPAALWLARPAIAVSTLLFVVPAAAFGLWLTQSPEALQAFAPEELREIYVEEQFADYYTDLPSTQFGAVVTTNNIQVAIAAFGAGALLALPSAYVLVLNGLSVGGAWGMMAAGGEQLQFWTLILPHGLLELTAIFVAGGAGIHLGWALIDPGDRPRSVALREAGRRAVSIVIALIAAFTVAGLIEGFVTGAEWPAWVRVGIGAVAWLAFVLYAVVLGPRAAKAGLTGAIGEEPIAPRRQRPEPAASVRPATAAG